MSFSVRAPGSSANLGPGFDALAVAIDLWMQIDVRPCEGQALVDAGAPDLHGGDNLVLTTARRVAADNGWRLPGASVSIQSDIPVARGLGSSAAAIVCGIALASELSGHRLDSQQVIDQAGAIEGHADNIAAAALGGITVAIKTSTGFQTAQLARDLPWTAVLFVPRQTGLTVDARGILPMQVPIEDAAFNVGRSALLVHALRTGDEAALRAAMEDRLHEPYRQALYPHLELIRKRALEAGAACACLSGSGPAILVLTSAWSADDVAAEMQATADEIDLVGEVIQPGIAVSGCCVDRG